MKMDCVKKDFPTSLLKCQVQVYSLTYLIIIAPLRFENDVMDLQVIIREERLH